VVEGIVEEIRVDDFYAVLAKEAVDLLYLVGREIYFLKQVEDFARLQRPGRLAGLEEFLDLLLRIRLETLALLKRNISETNQRSTNRATEGVLLARIEKLVPDLPRIQVCCAQAHDHLRNG
jgi:hypothetical protein